MPISQRRVSVPRVQYPNNRHDKRIGEVVRADSATLSVQCYDLYGAPPLGALMQVGDPVCFAVVQSIRTEPLDPGRPVLARGGQAATVEEVYADNPQIERLLTTRFEALIVGYENDGLCLQLLPPTPPLIHSFVRTGSPTVVERFTENLDFLRFLVNSGPPLADEVVVACLRVVAACRTADKDFMTRAGRALSTEMVGDAARLNSILRRVQL